MGRLVQRTLTDLGSLCRKDFFAWDQAPREELCFVSARIDPLAFGCSSYQGTPCGRAPQAHRGCSHGSCKPGAQTDNDHAAQPLQTSCSEGGSSPWVGQGHTPRWDRAWPQETQRGQARGGPWPHGPPTPEAPARWPPPRQGSLPPAINTIACRASAVSSDILISAAKVLSSHAALKGRLAPVYNLFSASSNGLHLRPPTSRSQEALRRESCVRRRLTKA